MTNKIATIELNWDIKGKVQHKFYSNDEFIKNEEKTYLFHTVPALIDKGFATLSFGPVDDMCTSIINIIELHFDVPRYKPIKSFFKGAKIHWRLGKFPIEKYITFHPKTKLVVFDNVEYEVGTLISNYLSYILGISDNENVLAIKGAALDIINYYWGLIGEIDDSDGMEFLRIHYDMRVFHKTNMILVNWPNQYASDPDKVNIMLEKATNDSIKRFDKHLSYKSIRRKKN